MRLFNRKRLPYSQQELSDHIGILGDLITKREKVLQLSIVTRSDVKQQKYLQEVDRYDEMIMTCQKSLEHMLKKNEKKAREGKYDA